MAHDVASPSLRHATTSRPGRLQEIEAFLAEAVSTFDPEALPALAGALEAARVLIWSRIAKPEPPCGDSDRLLTVDQVAERTGFSADYVYRHRSKLPFLRKVGRSVRASERQLDRWLSTRQQV